MEFKQCSKCKQIKKISEFYTSKIPNSRYHYHCKVCCKNDWYKYSENNKDKIREQDKNYKPSEEVIKRRRASSRAWKKKHPTKVKAQKKLYRALESNEILKPQECCQCYKFTTELDAHHCDYRKPLEVAWLCKICHSGLHGEERRVYSP